MKGLPLVWGQKETELTQGEQCSHKAGPPLLGVSGSQMAFQESQEPGLCGPDSTCHCACLSAEC